MFVEDFLCDASRRHSGRPSRIEGKVGDEFAQFVPGHTVFECTLQMNPELIGPLQGNQGGTGDKTAVAFGEPWPLPYVAEQNLFSEIDQLGHYRTNSLARRCRW